MDSEEGVSPPKKIKTSTNLLRDKKNTDRSSKQQKINPTPKKFPTDTKTSFEKSVKPNKKNSLVNSNSGKASKANGVNKVRLSEKSKQQLTEKPEDWNEFKKKKKELKIKRKQSRQGFDVLMQAKKLVDKIRRKSTLTAERNKLVNQLHTLFKGEYAKFALAHDSSRLVQCALKYGSLIIRREISKELMEIVVAMTTSKYGRHIVQRMLKHGEPDIKASVISAFYGSAVKLASHVISSPILEYAYSTWATQQQKHHLLQEFFSDMYKKSKDDKVKHLRDVYTTSPDLKTAVLGAVKENLSRILNKNLFDSGLVQTVLYQFLSECTKEDKEEMITQICPHIVVISNSKDGSRAAMQCLWHGSNKDRKVAVKALKEHIIELCKHEHGHCTVIALLDSADDTVLLHKVLLSEILKNSRDLANDEHGRKVLLWLVAPANSAHFHPTFIKELEEGRLASTSKKDTEIRRKELLQYAVKPLVDLVQSDPAFWLSKSSLAIEMVPILKSAPGDIAVEAYKKIAETICDPEWRVENTPGIEHSGVHIALKKLLQFDKVRLENGEPMFGACIINHISKDTIGEWIKCNKGCFILVVIYENTSDEVQQTLRKKMQSHLKKLKKSDSSGAKILVKKLCE